MRKDIHLKEKYICLDKGLSLSATCGRVKRNVLCVGGVSDVCSFADSRTQSDGGCSEKKGTK